MDELLDRFEPDRVPTGVPAPPALRTVLVTCMDARVDPAALFGLAPGEVHVLRNAGGVVTEDVLRSLAISQRKLGTRDVVLVQHTGCGMGTFTDDEFVEELVQHTGRRPTWRPQAFADVGSSVRSGMHRLTTDPFLSRETRVRGFVLDLDDSELHEVDAPVT
jgi:carbonic anhydrase